MLPGIKYKSLKITEDLTIDLDFISLHLSQIHLKRNFSYHFCTTFHNPKVLLIPYFYWVHRFVHHDEFDQH